MTINDLKRIRVKMLRSMCLERDLSSRGTKSVLCERLRQYESDQVVVDPNESDQVVVNGGHIRPHVQTLSGSLVIVAVPKCATFGDLNDAVAQATNCDQVNIYHMFDDKMRKYRPERLLSDVGISDGSPITVVPSIRRR